MQILALLLTLFNYKNLECYEIGPVIVLVNTGFS